MKVSSYISEPTIQYLHQLLDEIAFGQLQIPRFQRPFVWKLDQCLELLRSIREGIPFGSIMVWRTRQDALQKLEGLGPYKLPQTPTEAGAFRSYILDGFQRLSTLFCALTPLSEGTAIPDSKESWRWNIYFDLEEKEGADFIALREGERAKKTWLPLNVVLDSILMVRFQRSLAQAGVEKLIPVSDEIGKAFHRCKVPIIPVVTDDINQAALTFQRINSQGSPMSEIHMVNALTWREDFELVERVEEAKTNLVPVGWDELDQRMILHTCKAALGLDLYSDVDKISKAIRESPDIVDQAVKSLTRAAKFLNECCEIRSYRLLPYGLQGVMIAEAFRNLKGSEIPEVIKERIKQWFWLTTYWETFAGLSGSRAQNLLNGLREFVKSKGRKLPPLSKETLRPLRGYFDFRAARSKALTLRLAELKPRSAVNNKELDAYKLLADHGASTIVQVIPKNKIKEEPELYSSPANRFIIDPAEESYFRQALLQDVKTCNRDFLQSHAISEKAAQALEKQDYGEFLRIRLQNLNKIEKDFVDSIVKSYFDSKSLQLTEAKNKLRAH